jgi:hypothetical protein
VRSSRFSRDFSLSDLGTDLASLQEFLKSSGLEDAAIQDIENALGLGGNATAPATGDDADASDDAGATDADAPARRSLSLDDIQQLEQLLQESGLGEIAIDEIESLLGVSKRSESLEDLD